MKVIPTVLGALAIGYLGYLGVNARIDGVAENHHNLSQGLKILEARIDDVEYYDKIRFKDKVSEIEQRVNLNESQQKNEMDIEDEGL